MRALRTASLLLGLAGLLAVGCSSKPTTGDGGDTKQGNVSQNDLKQIGRGYYKYVSATARGPAKADDLAKYPEINEHLLDLLKSGEVVFSYNVNIAAMNEFGTSDTVLAYHKDVPEKGGLVLMGDGEPKRMSADEFKKAHVAKGNP